MKPPIKDVPAELNRRLDDLELRTTGDALERALQAALPKVVESAPKAAVVPPACNLEGVTSESISVLSIPSGASLHEFAIRLRGSEGWNTLVTTANTATFISLASGDLYEVKVRILNVAGGSGDWSKTIVVRTDEDRLPPPIPEDLDLVAEGYYIRAKVNEIKVAEYKDLAGYEFHASIETGFEPDDDTLVQVGMSNRAVFHVPEAGQTWYVVVRSLDSSRNYSAFCDEVSVLIPPVRLSSQAGDPAETGEITVVEGSLEIDDCDTIGDWESEQSEAIRIEAADPGDVAEGTGAIKVEIDKYNRKINQAVGIHSMILGQYTAREFGGQRFKANFTDNCKRISVPMSKVGTPAAATLHIYSDSGGDPNASLGSATLTAPAESAWYYADFAGAGIALVSGTYYWIIIDTVVNATNYWQVLYSTTDVYEPSVTCGCGMGPTATLTGRFDTWDWCFRIFDDTDCTGKHFKISSLAAKDLSIYETIEFQAKQKKTITDAVLKVSIGEAALGEQLHTIGAIGSTYGTEVWDISAIAATDKNAITEFGIEVDVVDNYTLELYLDYFRGVIAKKVKVKFSDEVAQIYPAINPGPGEGHITLLPWSYDSIGQGTWAIVTNANQVFNGAFVNSSDTDGDNYLLETYLAAGTYAVKVCCVTTPGSGIVDIDIDGTERWSFDFYSAGVVYNVIKADAGSPYINETSGLLEIKIRVDGKNGASTGHKANISSIALWRTV